MSGKYPGGFVTLGAPAGYSVAFDGTGDYLSFTNNASTNLGTGDFTYEAWIYPTALSSYNMLFASGASNHYLALTWGATSSIYNLNAYNGAVSVGSTPATIPINQWVHIAYVRISGTLYYYVNGIANGSSAFSGTFGDSTGTATIGYNTAYAGSYYFNGYMSNVRMIKGTGIYTGNFTPPTQLFPITNTSLLTCQSPTIRDNSTNNFTITANGNAAVSNFTPFTGYTAGASGFQPALGAAAPGVWTLDEATNYQGTRRWPIYDPSFNQTTLMLHGNGTNGAQNNTFLDNSTNNFTITRSGNTTQGTFSPFSQTGWSTFFPSESGIYFAPQTYFDFSTGSNTIELWFYPTVASVAYNLLVANPYGVVNPLKWGFSVTSAGLLNLYRNVTFASTNAVSWNQWNHIALVTDISAGNTNATIRFYINGVASTLTGCDLSGWTNSGENIWFQDRGGDPFSTTYDCYMSNFRWVRSVVYTAPAIPVPTAPLTAIDNTRLLTLSTNNFVDLGGSKLPLTVGYGTPSVQSFSPFVPTVTTPVTYSNYFDGSGDYLTLPNNSAFGFGTGDFTIEAWYCFAGTIGTYQRPWWFGDDNDNAEINGSVIRVGGASQGTLITGTTTLVVNRWYHVALTRASGVYRLWLNGIQEGSSATNSYNSSARTLGIAATTGGANPITGNISNFRIVKGTALYTTSFTPPTSPLTNITNTSLLTCQSSTFIDNSSNNFTITVAGNVQPVTSPVPFAPLVDQTTLNTVYSTTLVGGSAYFNSATPDYLTVADNALLAAGTGDFTWEAWVYWIGGAGENTLWCTDVTNGVNIGLNIGGTWQIATRSVAAQNNFGAVVKNQWNYLAISRTATTINAYINGVRVFNGANSTNYISGGTLGIGAIPTASGNAFLGYISNLRWTKGTALYIGTTMTVPTAPSTTTSNGASSTTVELLTNFTNAGIIDSTADNVLQTVGNAQISTVQSKWGGSSIRFNGTTDYLVNQDSSGQNFNFGTGNFTVEFWINTASLSIEQSIFDTQTLGGAASRTTSFVLVVTTSGTFRIYTNSAYSAATSNSITINTWNHIAMVRNSGTITIYINGTSGVSISNSTNFSTSGCVIGKYADSNNGYLNGYLDDLRVAKGIARYLSNFTPPTSQLQSQ
jgi:hypothetical protein